MFKFFKRLRNKLRLLSLSEEEILNELGYQYFRIDFQRKAFDYKKLPKPEQIAFLREMNDIHENIYFQDMLEELKVNIVRDSFNDSSKFNHLLCGKLTIHAITLIERQLHEYASIYVTEHMTKPEEFNKYDLI